MIEITQAQAVEFKAQGLLVLVSTITRFDTDRQEVSEGVTYTQLDNSEAAFVELGDFWPTEHKRETVEWL